MVRWPASYGSEAKLPVDVFVMCSNSGMVLFPACTSTWIRIIQAKMSQGSGGVKTECGDLSFLNNEKRHYMKNLLFKIFIVSAPVILLVKCSNLKTETPEVTSTSTKENFAGFESQVKWGEHLVIVSACHDCHSPKKGYGLDSANLLAGYIGTSVADVSRKDAQNKGWAVTTDLTS